MTPDLRFTGDDLRKTDPKFQAPRYGQYLRAVEDLDRFARDNFDKRVIDLALRWVLDQPGVSVALMGARRPAQLDSLDEAMGWTLGHDAMRQIDQIASANVSDPVGPEFMAPPALPRSADSDPTLHAE
jgi:aryl-alcohol dehydrogenase-like predicted oxidoreductase